MRRRSQSAAVVLVAAAAAIAACSAQADAGDDTPVVTGANSVGADNRREGLVGSADFELGGGASVDGLETRRRFDISRAFPRSPEYQTAPPPEADIALLKGNDPAAAKAEAERFIEALGKYIYEDMADRGSEEEYFRLDDTKQGIARKRWYHMPWLHTPDASLDRPGRGRESLYGMTREVDLRGPVEWPRTGGQNCIAQNWGIGFFNEPGGYTIGRVFPEGSEVHPELGKFPKGTVSFKILFTAATPEQLPEVEGAYTVEALVNGGGKCLSRNANERRVPTKLRHIQMDAMVKYGDAEEDWIFAAWAYKKGDTSHWHGMHPIGVQFGVKANETIVTSDAFVPNGFSRQGETPRLNGPADNRMSSCYSCHARAQWPELSQGRLPFAPRNETDERFACLLHDWRGEEACGLNPGCAARGDCIPAGRNPVAPTGVGLDMSLQFALALRNRERFVSR
jgi:hypothetical protein